MFSDNIIEIEGTDAEGGAGFPEGRVKNNGREVSCCFADVKPAIERSVRPNFPSLRYACQLGSDAVE